MVLTRNIMKLCSSSQIVKKKIIISKKDCCSLMYTYAKKISRISMHKNEDIDSTQRKIREFFSSQLGIINSDTIEF